MTEKSWDEIFNKFIEREDDQITPSRFFDILEEISEAKIKRTIELKAKLVEGKLEFEPTPEVVVKGNEILFGENRIVVNLE
ncbi:TPA: hypothetical protein EYP66_23200 [Candidatus Poribacteria bacterium]|nr:hypothetical protein [Candidatus Poribacteria bacterium]